MFGFNHQERAYVAPFAAFMVLLALGQFLSGAFGGHANWMVAAPQYWIFPLQTVLCGGLLWHFRSVYPLPSLSGRDLLWAIGIGVLVLLLWIAPQQLLGMPGRYEGFEPGYFGDGAAWWANVGFRFLRLVIIVPLVEEIFWRGFLLRWLIREDFTNVPFGTWHLRSFLIVTGAFMLAHQMPDWPAAAAAGALYNLVAIRTKSLTACVLAHAITNAALGAWVLRTGQWGFW